MRRIALSLGLLATAGCDAVFGINSVAGPDGDNCFGSGAFALCVPPVTDPSPLVVDQPTDFVTDVAGCEHPMMLGDAAVCVVLATSIVVNARLGVHGPDPLVLISTGDVTVSVAGSIDVSSGVGNVGPGTPSPSCVTEAGASSTDGGGGGGGGGFGTNGGAGAGSPVSNVPKLEFPEALFAGCAGSAGGSGDIGGSPGEGGSGGGAIYLIARGNLSVAGSITAHGAGGHGGMVIRGGGGGGGSGGMIVLHAQTIDVTVSGGIDANGGGGGGGADDSMAGGDGLVSSDSGTVAVGGSAGGSLAGSGGNGGLGTLDGDPAIVIDGGGGGGGGGVGFIRILSGTLTNHGGISPPSR